MHTTNSYDGDIDDDARSDTTIGSTLIGKLYGVTKSGYPSLPLAPFYDPSSHFNPRSRGDQMIYYDFKVPSTATRQEYSAIVELARDLDLVHRAKKIKRLHDSHNVKAENPEVIKEEEIKPSDSISQAHN